MRQSLTKKNAPAFETASIIAVEIVATEQLSRRFQMFSVTI